MRDLLREARKKKGLTQAALAKRLGVPRHAVAQWELGRFEPGEAEIKKLSRILGIPVETLREAAQKAREERRRGRSIRKLFGLADEFGDFIASFPPKALELVREAFQGKPKPLTHPVLLGSDRIELVSPQHAVRRREDLEFIWRADPEKGYRIFIYDPSSLELIASWNVQKGNEGEFRTTYPSWAPPLIPGRDYGWTVHMVDEKGRTILESSPGHFRILTAEELKDLAEAERAWREVLSRASLFLGALYEALGLLEEAKAMYREGLKYSPNNRALCLRLGRVCEAQKLYEEARGWYSKAEGVRDEKG